MKLEYDILHHGYKRVKECPKEMFEISIFDLCSKIKKRSFESVHIFHIVLTDIIFDINFKISYIIY